jgi:hypothetical protein
MALQPIKKITNRIIADNAIQASQITDNVISVDKLGYRDYFKFRFTSTSTFYNDNAETVVDFHTYGTVDQDTSSGFSGDTNSTWQAPGAGIWLFGYQVSFVRDDGVLRDISAGLQYSSNGGSTWVDMTSAGHRFYDGSQDGSGGYIGGSVIGDIGGQDLYRLMAYANTGASQQWRIGATSASTIGGTNTFDDQGGTIFWGVRIY